MVGITFKCKFLSFIAVVYTLDFFTFCFLHFPLFIWIWCNDDKALHQVRSSTSALQGHTKVWQYTYIINCSFFHYGTSYLTSKTVLHVDCQIDGRPSTLFSSKLHKKGYRRDWVFRLCMRCAISSFSGCLIQSKRHFVYRMAFHCFIAVKSVILL